MKEHSAVKLANKVRLNLLIDADKVKQISLPKSLINKLEIIIDVEIEMINVEELRIHNGS
jgi:hypothetical protein